MRAIFVTGAMAHSFSPLGLVAGALSRSASEQHRAEIDALAIRKGGGKFAAPRIAPASSFRRPTTTGSAPPITSMCGTLVRVEIERATGALRIAKAYSVFECGQPLVPEVVLGQAQGGFAMGVGYALLETLPPLRRRPRQRAMESRTIPGRARLGPAAA